MATTRLPLDPDTVYDAYDRFVCGTTGCAGSTAVHTGRTIGGFRVRKVTARDVAEWATYDLGPLTCQCGRVTTQA